MTTDSDVEDRLRQFRPVGPPPRLRARCTSVSRPSRWPYVAAASLLLLALVTYRSSDDVAPEALRRESDAAAVARTAAWLGGGVEAEWAATVSLARFRADEALRSARAGSATASHDEFLP
jgi:hypothetical protein